jgi:hypothetical protein
VSYWDAETIAGNRKGEYFLLSLTMLFTAFVVAFYDFLRCGDFTVHDARLFDKEFNLCLSDISFQSVNE